MVDTEVYAPGGGEQVRAQWQQAIGGQKFLLNVCRQTWLWKGNDRLIHAFSRFVKEYGDWRLILMEWGKDIEQSKVLIEALDIKDKVLWEPMSSKPRLRRLQQAADVVSDQFVMAAYGTSVLESMAAGKPVLKSPLNPQNDLLCISDLPPFVTANEIDEIYQALIKLDDEEFKQKKGVESHDWVRRNHGYLAITERYIDAYKSALCF
ncbi:glycosyltransferase [Leptolyngbya sp. 'hensonii']|uniref:glycosyltransferase n=1 Tax=Leptolyngbya sp. 'hensonii' TaxID=1922337 RepID=UPI00209A9FB4|nr:glycosyltransferase [Leptolyngbya sp. 'hensonii']